MLEPMLETRVDMAPTGLPDNIRGLRTAEFERLVELGAFGDVRVELLEGQLVEVSPQGDAHSTITRVVAHWLARALPDGMILQQHSSVRAGEHSMPEPDIAVIPFRRGFHHPHEAYLVIEVADSSLRNDREIKSEIYARAGMREYWIIDIQHERVEVHTEPTQRGYTTTRIVGRGEVLRSAALPGFSLDVAAIFDC